MDVKLPTRVSRASKSFLFSQAFAPAARELLPLAMFFLVGKTTALAVEVEEEIEEDDDDEPSSSG